MVAFPSPPFAFDFRMRPVGQPLSRFVESIWYARGTVPYAREKIAPTGSTVAVIVLGDPILQVPSNGQGVPFQAERGFLVGPHDQPAVNEPLGETFAIGVVGTPVGCAAVFGVLPSRLRGQTVDLETACATARLLRMRRLLAALDVSTTPVWTDLAQEYGWFDQAHLIRDFKRHTGVTPSAYVAAQRAHLAPAAAGESAGFVPES